MNEEIRKQLAHFLQEKLHGHCSGYMFSPDDVLEYINDFFKVQELIQQRDNLQKQIDELTKK